MIKGSLSYHLKVLYTVSRGARTEYFANIGGGELHLQKGTYNLLYCLYIPSNTTIIFEDGVTIRRMDKSTLFTLCSYNDLHTGKKFYGYNGVHDVKLIGKGNVVFDNVNSAKKLH